MALSEAQKEKILADFNTGSFTQRELAKKHGVGAGTINRLTKEKKPLNGTLVEQIVQTTIKQDDILEQMEQKNGTERNAIMQAALKGIDKAKLEIQFDNAAKDNQDLLDLASKQIQEYVNVDMELAKEKGIPSYAAIEHLPNVLAISKGTDQNRNQTLGRTVAAEILDEEDKPKTRKYIIRKDDDE